MSEGDAFAAGIVTGAVVAGAVAIAALADDEEDVYKCEQCGKTYKTQHKVERHIVKKHGVSEVVEVELESESDTDTSSSSSSSSSAPSYNDWSSVEWASSSSSSSDGSDFEGYCFTVKSKVYFCDECDREFDRMHSLLQHLDDTGHGDPHDIYEWKRKR